nr:hypothetical protein [Tanacetum cinerariifolium]
FQVVVGFYNNWYHELGQELLESRVDLLKEPRVDFCLGYQDQQKQEGAAGSVDSKGFLKFGSSRNEDHVSNSGANRYDNADVMMAMSAGELLDWIMDSGGSYHMTYKRDHLFNFEEYDGGNVLLGDGRECVYGGRVRWFNVKMQSVEIKVIKGSLVELVTPPNGAWTEYVSGGVTSLHTSHKIK